VNYDLDFNNFTQHGDFLVGYSTNEKVDSGKKTVSSIIVARPNTDPPELEHLKAIGDVDSIRIVSVEHGQQFVEESAQWIKCLEENVDDFECGQLVTTMMTMMTKLEAKRESAAGPDLKTTIISIKENENMELANDYFCSNKEDFVLNMMPLPYTYKMQIGTKDFHYAKIMVIWRAYIKGSEDVVKEDKKQKNRDGPMSLLEKLMQGTTI
jgi:hypothetical protein